MPQYYLNFAYFLIDFKSIFKLAIYLYDKTFTYM